MSEPTEQDILASDWYAERVARDAAEVLEEFADQIEYAAGRWRGPAVAVMLRDRAAALREPTP